MNLKPPQALISIGTCTPNMCTHEYAYANVHYKPYYTYNSPALHCPGRAWPYLSLPTTAREPAPEFRREGPHLSPQAREDEPILRACMERS